MYMLRTSVRSSDRNLSDLHGMTLTCDFDLANFYILSHISLLADQNVSKFLHRLA